MASLGVPPHRYLRLAFRLKRGRLSPEALNGKLPSTRLRAKELGRLLAEAEDAALSHPHSGLALAPVAQAEAHRLSRPLARAHAAYTLAVCLNAVDDWSGALVGPSAPRAGGLLSTSSGDFVIAFATSNRVPHNPETPLIAQRRVAESLLAGQSHPAPTTIKLLFQAAMEAAEGATCTRC